MAELRDLLKKKPLKSERLKIIDHKGTYYATFDGSRTWKVDDWLFKLMKLCTGNNTFEEIAKYLAKVAEVSESEIIPSLKDILDELERENFISYIDTKKE